LWSFVKDEVYVLPVPLNPEQFEGSDINSDCKKMISLYCKMFGTKSNVVLMCAGQQIEHILNFHRKIKNIFELLFAMV
jgi:hypothetical protein